MTNEELVIKIRSGIDMADNMLLLWQQCKSFIHKLALHYQGLADLDDLEQEGYLALYEAIDGFLPEYGYKFLTYAEHWIRQRMVRYIQNNDTVRIPVHEKEKIREYNNLVNSYLMHKGKKPTRKEIAKVMGVSEAVIINCERASKVGKPASLESYVTSDLEDITVGDMIADDVDIESDVLEIVQQEQLKRTLWAIVESLPEQQEIVLKQRYKENKTLKDIGNDLGVTLERVRQIENKATWSIRHSRKARLLRAFVDENIESMAYRHNGVGEFSRTWTSSTERVALKMLKD